jgi:hypothetical protein
MPQPIHDDIAQAILAKEKRNARAKAVLNRPVSLVPTFAATTAFVGVGLYLHSVERFEAPLWVSVLLIAGFACSALNTMELWTVRRRLDAVVTLLEQYDADHRRTSD